MTTDSMIFYRSFFEAIEENEDAEVKARLYRAILEYGLDGKIPDLKGAEKSIFKLIKPQIDANIRRRFNGSKGGRPSKPNHNQDKTKPKPNHNQDITTPEPNVNVNDNVNANVNVNANENVNANDPHPARKTYGIYNNVFLTDEERDELQKGRTPEQVEEMIENLSFYMHNNGKTYRDHFATMCKWEREDKKKEKERNKDDCINDNSKYDDADTWWDDYGKFLEEKEAKKNGTAGINNDG